MANTTKHIHSLDLCRGLAALAVLFYHVDFLFFGAQTIVPRGYLCVDFFFLLSGFVIASSYEQKLKSGLSLFEFSVYRIARMWPLVALATLLGLVVQLPRWQREFGGVDTFSLIITVLSNFFTLPTPASPNRFFFPLNGAAWSIFFEVVANFAYALLLPVLSRGRLITLIASSGAMLAFGSLVHNTLDVGWIAAHFAYGFPRVAFSFFLGVYIWRMERIREHANLLGPLPLTAGLLAILAALSVPQAWLSSANGLYDVMVAACLFPALLIVAVRTRLGPQGNSVGWFLGGISYSVYLLQTPLVIGFSGLPQVLFGAKVGAYIPWAGFVFLILYLPIAYLTWIYFEQPTQRWLKAALLRSRPPVGSHGGGVAGQ